ncbi:MAG: NYN domain-containing protein [Dehalococcoidales bacterium]|nr:NYN domain-containing protein [Dehalococcoidales bacterium]
MLNSRSKQQRVYVFIDGSNLYHGIKEFVGDGKRVPIDMRRFAEELVEKERRLVKILYYTAPISQQENKEGYRAQQKFLSVLKQTSFLDLRLGRLVKRCREFDCEHCGKKCQKVLSYGKGHRRIYSIRPSGSCIR